jgi:hypothetical protein
MFLVNRVLKIHDILLARYNLASKVPLDIAFMIYFIANGVGLSPLYYGHFWPIVPAPDDR